MLSYLARKLKSNIEESNLSIYDTVSVGDPKYWIPSNILGELLSNHLVGLDLKGLALRTRSKRVKEEVCIGLGYKPPKKFQKTQPKFLCQNFDVYTQKSNNLQIWNEEISPSRRYVLIKISDNDTITKVKVVTGDTLSELDKTGKLTQKYQAKLKGDSEIPGDGISPDTVEMQSVVEQFQGVYTETDPTSYPTVGEIMDIKNAYDRLSSIVGERISYVGALQERNRGAELHKLVCSALGYSKYRDNGQFPDVRHQLIEVKLQTSPTVDLGLFLPSEEGKLDMPLLNDISVRMCDVRYAIFYGETNGDEVEITKLFLVTGKDFFKFFNQFGGNEVNKKLQIPLPSNFL